MVGDCRKMGDRLGDRLGDRTRIISVVSDDGGRPKSLDNSTVRLCHGRRLQNESSSSVIFVVGGRKSGVADCGRRPKTLDKSTVHLNLGRRLEKSSLPVLVVVVSLIVVWPVVWLGAPPWAIRCSQRPIL